MSHVDLLIALRKFKQKGLTFISRGREFVCRVECLQLHV